MPVRGRPIIHGHCAHGKTPEYLAYVMAKQRCLNSHCRQFKDYGGRGIKFLFRSYQQFFKHIGRKPSPKLVLDRIDNDGHYERGNVRWVTRSKSSKNRRRTRRQLLACRRNAKIGRMKLAEVRKEKMMATPPKIPWTKPDPAMVKVVLRVLRDQLKAQHGKKQSAVRSSPKDRD